MANSRPPKQLELDLGEGSPTMPDIGLDVRELALVISLCQTARDFLWGKLLRGDVPEAHAHKIKAVCHDADQLIEKLETTFKPEGATQ